MLAATNQINPDNQLQSWQEATQANLQAIQSSDDTALRAQAAQTQQLNQVRGLAGVITDPNAPAVDQQGAEIAFQSALHADVQSQQESALERQAIQNIQDLASQGNDTQARVMANLYEYGGPEQVIQDQQTKELILQREIEKAGLAVQGQSWSADAIDFVAGMIPLYESTGNVGNIDVTDHLKSWYDGVLSGTRQRSEVASLWSLPPDEFARVIRDQLIPNVQGNSTFLGYHNQSEHLEILSHFMRTPSPFNQNVSDTVNNVGLLPSVKTLRALTRLPSLLIRNGARQEAAVLTTQAAETVIREGSGQVEARTGMSAEDVTSSLQTSVTNPEPVPTEVPIQSEANFRMEALRRGQELIDNLSNLAPTRRLTTEELSAATQATQDRLEREVPRDLVDVTSVDTKLADGSTVRHIQATVGRVNGEAYASEENVHRYFSQYNTPYEAFKDESGGWWARLKTPVTEEGFYTVPIKRSQMSWFTRHLASARRISEGITGDQAQVASNRLNKILSELDRTRVSVLKGLSQASVNFNEELLTASNKLRKWFTDPEINQIFQRRLSRQPTPVERNAYHFMRDVSDIEYTLRNDDLYKQAFTKGEVTVSIPGHGVNRVNAFIRDTPESVPSGHVYNPSDRVHYNKTNSLTEEHLQQKIAEGYTLVQTHESVLLPDGWRVQNFLVRKSNLERESLRRDQLAYLPGGHTMYPSKWFAKQTQRGIQPDGSKFLLNPGVFVTGGKAEVAQWVDLMERARVILSEAKGKLRSKDKLSKAYKSAAQKIDEIMQGHPGMPSGKEFVEGMTKEHPTWDVNEPFRVLYDRELPEDYNTADPDTLKFVDTEEVSQNGYLRTQGRMYYGHKGDRLLDYQGNPAVIYDPYRAINTSLRNIASLSSFSDYKMSAVNRWYETFKRYTNVSEMPKNASPMYVFNNAKLKIDSVPGGERIRQAAEAQRDVIRRNLGWKTDSDRAVQEWKRSVSEWVVGDSAPDSTRAKFAKSLENWWESKSPVNIIRGFAFHSKLGLFNIAQYPVQISTLGAIFSLSGRKAWLKSGGEGLFTGLQALGSIPGLEMFLSKGAGEDLLDKLVQHGYHKVTGFPDAEEFKIFMRSAKESGFLNINNTHQYWHTYGEDAAFSTFGRGWERFKQAGTYFFSKAEEHNRIAAFRVAWDDTRELLPNVKPGSAEFIEKLHGRAEDYAMRMSRTSSAEWQHGILSVPTQFWAYNVRVWESLLGDTFTRQQKIRLALGQFLIAGAAGIPFLGAVTDFWNSQDPRKVSEGGNIPDIGTVGSALQRGLLDQVMYYSGGGDVNLGRRYGTGYWITDTINNLFNWSSYGDQSTYDVLGGAGGSTLSQTLVTLPQIWHHTVAESGGDLGEPLTRNTVLGLLGNISSVSSAFKAYFVARYGEYISNRGTVQASDIPSQDTVAVAFGLQPHEVDLAGARLRFLKSRSDDVTEASQVITQYRERMIAEPDRAAEWASQINLFMKSLPPEIRVRALQRAKPSRSMLDSLTHRVEQEIQLDSQSRNQQ